MSQRFTNPYAVEVLKKEHKTPSIFKEDPKKILAQMFFQSVCERLLDGAKQQIAHYQYHLHSFQIGGGEVKLVKEGKEFIFVSGNRADTRIIKEHLNEASIIASKF